MATAQATKSTITLKGSTAIVTEFFGYAVNSILYQRGIYPPETFERKQKYGLGMLVTTDDGLKTYLVSVLQQINDWMMTRALQKLVLVVTAVGSGEVLERWVFDVEQEGEETADGKLVDAKDGTTTRAAKSEKEITGGDQRHHPPDHGERHVSAAAGGGVHVRPARVHGCGLERPGGVGGERRAEHRERRGAGQAAQLLHRRAQGGGDGLVQEQRGLGRYDIRRDARRGTPP
jgi:hypothetical protein